MCIYVRGRVCVRVCVYVQVVCVDNHQFFKSKRTGLRGVVYLSDCLHIITFGYLGDADSKNVFEKN